MINENPIEKDNANNKKTKKAGKNLNEKDKKKDSSSKKKENSDKKDEVQKMVD